MKTIFKSIIALMAAMAATAVLPSCQKVLDEPGSSGVTQFYVGEVEDLMDEDAPDPEGVETKTVFGTPSGKSFPVLWTSGSFVDILCTGDDALEVGRTWAVYPSKDRKTASIRGDKLDLTGETGLSFIMVSPQDCFVSHTLYQPMKVKILTTQTPVTDGNGSPDEKTMILVAKTQTYATAPETVKFSPKHMTAYILLSLTNVSSIGKLQSVTVSSPTEYLSGPGTIDYSGTFPVLAPTSQASKSVTANVTSPTAVWLSCYPAKSKTLTIKATGSAGSLTRTISVPTGKALKAGVISGLTVDMNPVVHVTGVTLDKTSAKMYVGTPVTLTATVTPSNAADKSVTWSSSNTTVATVSSSGVVTPKKEGTTTITVTTVDGGKTATCEVSVYKVVKSVSVTSTQDGVEPLYDDGEFHITPTKSVTLQYKVTYSDGTTSTNSGAKITVESGSGVSLSGRTVSCTSVGQTAKIRIAGIDPSSGLATGIYQVVTFKTWSDPTSVNVNCSEIPYLNGGYWAVAGSTYTLNCAVYPSTARQKVNLAVTSDPGYWELSRVENCIFRLETDFITAVSYTAYSNLHTYLVGKAWHDASVSSTTILDVSSINVTKTKPFDYVCYSKSNMDYKIIDGGLRWLVKTNEKSTLYQIKDFYCLNKTPEIPSGYTLVGIVTAVFTGDENNHPTTTGLVNPNQLVTRGPDGVLLPIGKIHGFAISLQNAEASKWCQDYDNVDSNANWSRELWNSYNNVSILAYNSETNQMNGFNLTICAHQYNVWRGSSHSIVPANMVWNYPAPGYELSCYAFPRSNPSLTFVMRPWFVPTVWNWLHLADGNGKFYNAAPINHLNDMLGRISGAHKVFPYSTDSYWTINENNSDNSIAYMVVANGVTSAGKRTSAGVRPFMIF